ncbi:hypothetical protein PVAND_010760 [Polypedilum vanderplanki]|uniref:CABIT domain-containing protein n=1 Tax=Polypedilum vanderplanki TaxID=319348 RepID=A0A9J6CHG5_POLVA|nr:hypothetical protein PVAND_010760 [Polypedilum vanderplanki]
MTDAIIKLSDMHMQQRTIEYERQRHLANWLIESSPHMPKPVQCQQPQHKKNKKIFTTSIFHDSFLFLSKIGTSSPPNQSTEQEQITQSPAPITVQQQQHTNLSKTPSAAAFTSSQTNLPLQIVQSSRDGNKPKLRRFNSHDTSANMFSVADFENARLARRNELELVRQKQRYKMNSLSSGCDSSTGDSKGSKLSNESKIINNEPMSVEFFLDRFSLPRIARLIVPSLKGTYDEKVNQSSNPMTTAAAVVIAAKSKKSINHGYPIIANQQQQQSLLTTNSHETATTSAKYQLDDIKTVNAVAAADNNNNGELFLLYRHLKKYKVYHAINVKSGTNRKKGIKIPQDFTGYFSFVNEKGTPTATLYTTMIQLVRERVYKFLSVDNMQAYTESNPGDNINSKSHYVKTTAKAGEVFRLLAVFEDGGQNNSSYSSTKKDNLNSIGREKEKGRYVQLMSESRQIIYVALSTKGKFYEIEHSSMQQHQQMYSKSNSGSQKSKQLNTDCVHRISNIITDETTFPISLKFISKHVSGLTHASIPENIKITKVSIENSIIACPIDETEFCNPLHLVKLYLNPDMKFMKSTLGFENEKVMFSNQNVQNLLKFCQFNCDNFVRAIEYETLPKEKIMKSTDNLSSTANKVKSKTSAFTKFFSGGDKNNSPAHEREDSIIFLSKNDLENLEQQKQINQESQEKMKVFQSNSGGNNKKGWFKNLRNSSSASSNSKTNSFVNLNSNSMDRYQDMSKMIQERFGTIEINENPSTTLKSSSEISYDLNERTNKAMQKCFSLQNIELNSSIDIQPPDLVAKHRNHSVDHNHEQIEKDLTYDSGNGMHSSNDSVLNSNSNPRQQSFITEKLFNEFYVKTKQYSKSSSSLHQLLHFSVPQKMNIRETSKKVNKVEEDEKVRNEEFTKSALMHLQLPPPPSTEPNSSSENENIEDSLHEDDTSIDDLPYCSVRDSIVHAHVVEPPRATPTESIYAEICAGTPPISSSNASEFSYKIEKPIKPVRNNNISSIRISFGQDVQTIISSDPTVKYN